MHILAVMGLDGPPEPWAKLLADALGRTTGEFIGRVRTVAPGPAVLATFGDIAQAQAVADVLRPAGLLVLVTDPGLLLGSRPHVYGRRVFLPEKAGAPFEVETRQGDRHAATPAEVRCLIRATGHWEEAGVETETHRRFAAGRALMTGGLMMTRKVSTERQTTSQKSVAVLLVGTAGGPTFVLREADLAYDSLGARMEASRVANFNVLIEAFREGCPQAAYDDRLLTRGGQSRVLGGSLDPTVYLELAATLVALALGGDFATAGEL